MRNTGKKDSGKLLNSSTTYYSPAKLRYSFDTTLPRRPQKNNKGKLNKLKLKLKIKDDLMKKLNYIDYFTETAKDFSKITDIAQNP